MRTAAASHRDVQSSSGTDVLLALLRAVEGPTAGVLVRSVSSGEWHQVLETARQHGVTALLHRAVKGAGALADAPEHVQSMLWQQRRTTAFSNLRIYGEFKRIAQALGERDIPFVALKGLHLAELVYRDISLRPMIDLDLLVPRSQRERALSVMGPLGYRFDEPMLEHGFEKGWLDATEAVLDGKYHAGLRHRRFGTLAEIHWSLDDPLYPYSPPLEEIWRSAVPARIENVDTLVMSPELLLLHVCAHLSYNHIFAFGLRALCDIAEIVSAHPALDWAAVVDHGQRHGWRIGVAAALRLARDHVGAAVPGYVIAAIGGETLSSARLAEAFEHLLSCKEMPDELHAAPNLMILAGHSGLGARAAIVWKRVFVPRAELALIYGVPERSARLPFYYSVRLWDLIRRYAGSAWALSVSNPELSATAARHARLAKWIAGG